MADRVFDDEPYDWYYEIEEDVAIFYLKGWQGFPDEELQSISDGYREVASQDDINATIAIMDQTKALPPATQDYMAEQWTENGKYVDVEKVAFVSQGPIGLTIKANIEVPGAEIENFDDLEKAKEWAKKN